MANKTISFKYDGKEYTLEFTRDTVRQMERNGFVAEDIVTKPATTIPDLFAGAFIKHHNTVKRDKRDKMFNSFTDKQKLIRGLIDMYNDTLDTLLDDESGNVEWTPSWEIEDED